jgi:hypothetical protein
MMHLHREVQRKGAHGLSRTLQGGGDRERGTGIGRTFSDYVHLNPARAGIVRSNASASTSRQRRSFARCASLRNNRSKSNQENPRLTASQIVV